LSFFRLVFDARASSDEGGSNSDVQKHSFIHLLVSFSTLLCDL